MKRSKRIAKCIKLVYSSLESHLDYTHKGKTTGKDEDHRFHRKAVQEYSTVIKHLSRLY